MRFSTFIRTSAAAAICLASLSAFADSATATFTSSNGGAGPVPGGTATLTLQNDGTINGAFQSLAGGILLVGLDSLISYPLHDFSSPATASVVQTFFGTFLSGAVPQNTFPLTLSFSVGAPGQFSTVSDVYGGSNAQFDAFMYVFNTAGSDDGDLRVTQYGGNFVLETTTPPVPEPETYTLMLAGLGIVGWIGRRRLRKAVN